MLGILSSSAIVHVTTRRFYDIRLQKNVVTLKSGSEVAQGHWKWHHSKDCVWFPISVL